MEEKYLPGMQFVIKFLSAIILSFLSTYILIVAGGMSYQIIHTVVEIFCVSIAVSTFLLVWNVSKIQKTNLILGFGFLAVAIFDTSHIYFWHGLGLSPTGYYDLSIRYWLLGRAVEALLLLLSTTKICKLPINRWVGLAFTLYVTSLTAILFYQNPGIVPVMLTPSGVTTPKIVIEYVIIGIFILTLFRLYKGYFHDNIVTKRYLMLALIIAVPAELTFTVSTSFDSSLKVLGHVLKANYYYFFLKAVFEGYVIFPYKMLRVSEERFFKAFRSSPVLKSIKAAAGNRYIDVNDKWLQTTGYTRAEVIGKTSREINLYPDEILHNYNEISSEENLTNRRITLQTKSGELREGVFSTQHIELEGEPCILVVTMDTTDQLRSERELIRLERLNLIGQMAAAIGHEVRNPMTTVRGFLQMLGTKPECQNYQDYFKIMIEELDRANSIITEFLSLSANKAADLQELNLNKIIDDLFPLLQSDALNADKNVRLEQAPVADLLLDRGEMHQLILNLVRNGYEAMKKGETVTIRTYSDGGDPVLAISDQGPGIDPQILEKIGTPFLTTKENGTGMGLATCFTIAKRNNASLDFESNADGTTFFVRFKLGS